MATRRCDDGRAASTSCSRRSPDRGGEALGISLRMVREYDLEADHAPSKLDVWMVRPTIVGAWRLATRARLAWWRRLTLLWWALRRWR